MSSTAPSAKPTEQKPAIPQTEPSTFQTRFDSANELMWLPYRTMFDFLRRAHSSATQMLDTQRKFDEDLREIVRSQQDLFTSLSGRFLNLLSGIGTETSATESYGKSIEQFQDTTLATMREIGAAVAAAQASSFEALSHQLHSDEPESSNGHSRETAH
jgi:hypothetical protein